jgi:hypothetical protein
MELACILIINFGVNILHARFIRCYFKGRKLNIFKRQNDVFTQHFFKKALEFVTFVVQCENAIKQ